MKQVKIYSTPTCPYCHMAKEWLDAKEVPYTDVDVAADQDAAMEMVEKTGQMGVPVIEIDGQFIVGFNPEAIEGMLEE